LNHEGHKEKHEGKLILKIPFFFVTLRDLRGSKHADH
jgi:hypothetical protein